MHNNPIIKTIHHAINITINYIVVITDLIHVVQRIFDLLVHSYQIQSSIISAELREKVTKILSNSGSVLVAKSGLFIL